MGRVDAFRTEVMKEAFAENIDEDWIEEGFDRSDDGGDEIAAPSAPSAPSRRGALK